MCSERMPKILFSDGYNKINFGDRDYAYYFEEYIKGEDLYEIIKNSPQYDIDEMLNYLEKMNLNLKEMARNNIIHRDIKPKNIIVFENDYFLIDLGLCRQTCEDENLTVSFQKLGTSRYFSPEQRKGVRTDYKWDFRNDLYAIGIILVEMFIVEERKIPIIDDIDLRKLEEKWIANSTNERQKMFFNKIMIKLLSNNRFGRFKELDEIDESINQVREVKI
jgi:serine/threonine protein kinase